MSTKDRSSFGSKFGLIATAAGSAIGLGNIWRFPYIAGENGGAAFIIVYLMIVFVIGIPIMLAEFGIGRTTRSNVYGAFKAIAPKGKWYWAGYLAIGAALAILSFYSVVAGWTIEFLKESVVGGFSGLSSDEVRQSFTSFTGSGLQSVAYTIGFVVITAFIVASGVEKGIERYNKILMPLMVIILIGLAINSTTLSGFGAGVDFLLHPDFSKITVSVILEALGQAFFSMSLGMGCMLTYGSYVSEKDNMLSTAGSVAISDTFIAILAGLAIFPAVFTYGISPTSGPDLVFITLPTLFAQMPGGYFISIIFFLLLVIAAITSSVSLMEIMVAYIIEQFHLTRLRAVMVSGFVVAIFASLCALSQMPDTPLAIGDMTLFSIFDNYSATYMLPIGGLVVVIVAGWIIPRSKLKGMIAQGVTSGAWLVPAIMFIIKFVAPLVIAMIFVSKLGILNL